ncbi:protein kinase domain-containing protein [Candidatus Uabimicrobium amorphum]|uniref:Serine/threonine protein kinase n=1 Tax=Uabimicrobium amorphum TaxID=2596890 RepID=A0A5S9F140_UABAM|nr:protein kinase [Candidatus Uabimicrobium amorphum]BBM82207.1 serine/threonine protein kinase [Candidatus Uabimicrobium amorphum]
MDNFSIAKQFPQWNFHEQIGDNYLLTTYIAENSKHGKCVLKLFSKTLLRDSEQTKTFFEQLDTTIRISHINLAKVHQTSISEEGTYLFREFLEGESLESQLQKRTFTPIEATQMILDIAQGIFSGYPFGIVYNNIKPSNIIVDDAGVAKLCDYCLPAIELAYLSPEQIKKQEVSSKSDVYSLNIIYYEMVRKRFLFHGKTIKDIIELQSRTAIPPQLKNFKNWPKGLPTSIRDIICKNLNRDPQERDTPFHFVKQLNGILKSLKVPRRNTIKIQKQTVTRRVKRPSTDKNVWGEVGLENNVESQVLADESVTDAENIVFSEEKLEKYIQEEIDSALTKFRTDKNEILPCLKFYFPKKYEETIVGYLLDLFHEECWLIKDTDKMSYLEIEIDLEKGCIQKHYYKFENILETAISKAYEAYDGKDEDEDEDENDNNEDKSQENNEPTKGNHDKTIDSEDLYKTIDVDSNEFVLPEVNEDISVSEKDGVTKIVTEKGSVEIDSKDLSGSLDGYDLEGEHIETLNDITVDSLTSVKNSIKSLSFTRQSLMVSRQLIGKKVQITVDFDNRHEATAWVKFVRKYKLYKGKQFIVEDEDVDVEVEPETERQTFTIFIDRLKAYEKVSEHIDRIKEFFEGDYEISEMDRGGMGAILKLISKHDSTILSLRPENYWARYKFAEYLKSLRNLKGEEVFYAELPKGTEFVIKVGFEGYEESLIQEAKILTSLAENENICNTIIGCVQQGRLFARDEKEDQEKIGYYLMLEYAHQGNLEQIYKSCPDNRLSPSIAFAIMYGMIQSLKILSDKGIIHRDIKPQNILLDNNGIPKLTDFGLAITTNQASSKLTDDRKRLLRIVDEKFCKISIQREHMQTILQNLIRTQENSEAIDLVLQEKIEILSEAIEKLKKQEEHRAEELKERYRPISAEENALKGRFAGSLYYAAPEQFTTDVVLTTACDMYQLGMVIFTMLTGKKPVSGRNTFDIMSKILDPNKPRVKDHIESSPIVDILSELIEKMIQHQPQDRIGVEDVRKTMSEVLFGYALELKKEPIFTPKLKLNEKQQERWDKKVEYAKKLHKTCIDAIFSTVFQDRGLPELQ